MRSLLASIVLILLTSAAVMAFEPMTATIRVVKDELYDYVFLGEHPRATDGYDNAYDTISPGNLNADMGQPFISVTVTHPDWKPALRELRGDIRSLAKRQQWTLSINSSLAKGSPMNVALVKQGVEPLPKGVKLTLKDGTNKAEYNLDAHSYMIGAPGPGKTLQIIISAEQP